MTRASAGNILILHAVNFNNFVQPFRMTFSVSLKFIAGYDSQPVDTESPITWSHLRSITVHHGTGVSTTLTLHHASVFCIDSYNKI